MAHENATPRPWVAHDNGHYWQFGPVDEDLGFQIGDVCASKHMKAGDRGSANAALIVQAVNAYDTLRAEVDQCAIELEEAANVFDGRGFHGLARVYRGASLRARAALSEAQP